jgi:prepilin-type N-terminal cleavage/methylation domain-containing protein
VAGFSLVEILIVLTIIGILVTFGIGYIAAARPAAQLERGEVSLSAFLTRARNLAVSEESAVRVQFDVDAGEYWYQQLDRGTGQWNTVSEVSRLPEGVGFLAGSNTFPGGEAEFTPRGSLMAGGSITIVNSTGGTSVLAGNVATGRFNIGGGNLR